MKGTYDQRESGGVWPQSSVPFGKRTVSFKTKGEEVTNEGFPVDPCDLIAEALPGCHMEVPAGILRPSLEQKGD
jgi:hypothetical protein